MTRSRYRGYQQDLQNVSKKKTYAAELSKDPDHPSVSILTGLGPHKTSDGETPNLLISMS